MEPKTMRAVAIDRFGGPETLSVRTLPVPEAGDGEVLVRVTTAGVGEWDPFEREGGYAEMLGMTPSFPYVLGSEGAGTVATVGAGVDRFSEGDAVYAAGFLNPRGGFYAEYAAVDADLAAAIPPGLSVDQAAVMSGVGLTALRGLDDTLGLQRGESVVVVGASGGMGHLALQLAARLGARVLAVASGDDGVALCERLGADATVNGRGGPDAVRAAMEAFAPGGADAALLATGGEVADAVLAGLREGGRVAYPSGVAPEPDGPGRVDVRNFNGDPDRDIIDRFDRLVAAGPFEVVVDRTFPLEQVAEAHAALGTHHLGKLALRVA